jgi:hypothetical protein
MRWFTTFFCFVTAAIANKEIPITYPNNATDLNPYASIIQVKGATTTLVLGCFNTSTSSSGNTSPTPTKKMPTSNQHTLSHQCTANFITRRYYNGPLQLGIRYHGNHNFSSYSKIYFNTEASGLDHVCHMLESKGRNDLRL